MKVFTQFVLAATMSLGLIATAHASSISLSADGNWNEFTLDDFSSLSQGTEWIDANDSNSPDFGTALHFLFTIAQGFTGTLTVVDGGLSGDRFEVYNNGQSLGLTSIVNNDSDYSNDFSSNLNNTNFSNGIFTLNSGSYDITGNLFQTLQPFNATNGALKLEVSKTASVPEPAGLTLLFAGLSMLFIARRRI